MVVYWSSHNQRGVTMAIDTTRLAKLEERRKQIDAQTQQIKAREQQQERKRDTRRKILIGAAVLERVKNGRWSEDRLRVMMDECLTKEIDRRLFGLPPLEGSTGSTEPSM